MLLDSIGYIFSVVSNCVTVHFIGLRRKPLDLLNKNSKKKEALIFGLEYCCDIWSFFEFLSMETK